MAVAEHQSIEIKSSRGGGHSSRSCSNSNSSSSAGGFVLGTMLRTKISIASVMATTFIAKDVTGPGAVISPPERLPCLLPSMLRGRA